jgi:anti-sigma regulatory factor (Ser/Thr protein kinase)
MPHAEVTLPGLTSSVPTARRLVESLLSSWGHADLGWSAALCVSELAGNCALHARTEFTVRIELEGEVVRVEVSDGSLRVPSQRAYGTEATTGRGLRLVEEYSTRWGVDTTATGKTVWLVLEARPPALRAVEDDAEGVEALLASFSDDGDAAWGDAGRAALSWRHAA